MSHLRMALNIQFAAFGSIAFAPMGLSAPVPKATPYVKWTIKVGEERNGVTRPLVVKDLAIVGTERGELQAYNTDHGSCVWSYLHGKRIYQSPTSDGERVYFTAKDGLTAIDIATGKKDWDFQAEQGDGPALFHRETGAVFFADNHGTLYALDPKTGKKKWSADFLADAPADPPGFTGKDARVDKAKARPYAITCDGETIYLVVFDQSRVVAYAAATGKLKWSFQTRGWMGMQAAVNAEHVFIGSQDRFLYCLDKGTGKEVWKFETKGRADYGIAADEQSVFFTCSAGVLFSLNAKDGKERWRFEAERKPGGGKNPIYTTPILHRGSVLVAAVAGPFLAISAETGKDVWKIQPEENFEALGLLATDGKSFFMTMERPPEPNGKPGAKGRGATSLVAVSFK